MFGNVYGGGSIFPIVIEPPYAACKEHGGLEVNGNEKNDIGMVVIRGNNVAMIETLEPVKTHSIASVGNY
ncbi:uncharacterized protein A4U43_C10F5890 [Asparagus officinalis]|uniref:Uncharacterized protein n=1 Tax=Asparagus officinalis TaxID=4686 RepID=A0A5P1E109_ASPOF|nr:uncharacterized protein A4U43_C10F5890 [Asparagus officinalis]